MFFLFSSTVNVGDAQQNTEVSRTHLLPLYEQKKILYFLVCSIGVWNNTNNFHLSENAKKLKPNNQTPKQLCKETLYYSLNMTYINQ